MDDGEPVDLVESADTVGTGNVSVVGAPIALPDVYVTFEGVPLSVAAPGLRVNDYDPDGDAFIVSNFTQTANGTITSIVTSGAFTYVPDPGFTGTDTFTYRLRESATGVFSEFVTVTIEVLPDRNRGPVAVADFFGTPQGTTLTVTAPGLRANDVDPDGDPFIVSNFTPPANGALTSIVTSGAFTYVPDPGFTGTDTFTYRLSEPATGAFSEFVTVTIYVGVTPVVLACTPAASLFFSDWDIDPAVGPPDPRGEYAEITNDAGDGTAYDLAGCDFVVFDPFTENVTYAASAAGPLPDGSPYSFATTLPGGVLGQTMPPASLADGPSVFALIDGSAAVGQSVGDVLANADVVAAVILGTDGTLFGSVRGGATSSAAQNQALLDALARLAGAVAADDGVLDLSVSVAPNPVSDTGTFSFGLAEGGDVSVALYDALGRRVAVLAEAPYGPGRHSVALDASALPAGVYVVRLVAGGEAQTVPLTVVR